MTNSRPVPLPPRASEQRRPDWLRNDRRQSRPWVRDINDRRSGFDRRVQAASPQRG